MTRRISLLDRASSLRRAASSSCSAARGWTPSDDAASLGEPPCAATRATNHSLRDRPDLSMEMLTSLPFPDPAFAHRARARLQMRPAALPSEVSRHFAVSAYVKTGAYRGGTAGPSDAG